jgi:hypothetical protein
MLGDLQNPVYKQRMTSLVGQDRQKLTVQGSPEARKNNYQEQQKNKLQGALRYMNRS